MHAQAFRYVDHREHLSHFDDKDLFKKAAVAATEQKLREHPELRMYMGGQGGEDDYYE